jgi:hypothetical protein
MPSVKPHRRIIALLALLAVGWTALWPLVSAAHARITSEALPLCHQVGRMVTMDEAPSTPAEPGGQPRQHCPLCVMAFFCGFTPAPQPPVFVFSTVTPLRDVHCAQHTHCVATALPFGRAPPASFLAA